MKKASIVFTAIVMLFASTAFATTGEKVTAKVKAAFTNDFSGASLVNWEKTSDFYFASFTLNKVKIDAAYNEEGELVGTSRRIDVAQLPLSISLELSKKMEGYIISPTALELIYEGQTRYYITAQNDKQVVKLKCSISGDIEIESKSKK